MYAKIKKTSKGYAFEGRMDRDKNIYLLEGFRAVAQWERTGGMFVTALNKRGEFILPKTMHHGVTSEITEENFQNSLTNTPLVIPLQDIGLIACIVSAKQLKKNDEMEVNVDLFLPIKVEEDPTVFESKAKTSLVIYALKLASKQIIGMPTTLVNQAVIDLPTKYVRDFMSGDGIIMRKDFLWARLTKEGN